MKNYNYHNNLIDKKQLRQILGWTFTNYNSMQACSLADELKYLGFKYATQSGISISIEDLRIPFTKNLMLEKANNEIINSEKIYLKGKITDAERFQTIIDTWNQTSEALKDQVVYYFKNYDPLNSVYIMAFSGARGNLSQVRQLVGMRGLMLDPSGEIMNLPIKKNFREGLTITDYLISGYGARKGIVDTALKTANSGYLTRRLIDVAQDILIREKDCLTNHTFLIKNIQKNSNQIFGRVLNKSIFDPIKSITIATKNTQITPKLIKILNQKMIDRLYIRSPLTCDLYRAICQQCYGWDLTSENLVDIGEAIGILAGQSIGEPGTQLTMRTFHTGGIFTSKASQQIISPDNGIIQFSRLLETIVLRTNRGEDVLVTKNSGSLLLIPKLKEKDFIKIKIPNNTILFPKNNQYVQKFTVIGEIINKDKQFKKEIKPIFARTSGEIFIPKLKTQINKLNKNKLLWLLEGKLYHSPLNSYVNFYSDYKLNKNSFIFRTKIINAFPGKIIALNNNSTLSKRNILIKNKTYSLKNSLLFQLSEKINNGNSLLCIKNLFYLLYTVIKNNKTYLKITRKNQFAHLITDLYLTRTGGILYYDCRTIFYKVELNLKIYFLRNCKWKYINDSFNNLKLKKDLLNKTNNYFSKVLFRTLVWIEEETHNVNCEPNILLVDDGDFIAKNFEIIPGYFSKISGFVVVNQQNNLIKTITIKSGLIYKGNSFKKQNKKVYFPGEQIFSDISISHPSICKRINEQLLISTIKLYEFPYVKMNKINLINGNCYEKNLESVNYSQPNYLSNQKICFLNSVNLVLNFLNLKVSQSLKKKIAIELKNYQNKVEFKTFTPINLNNYIPSKLKYKNLNSCILIQTNQFIDRYTNLVYLESLTSNSLEIVKIKVNRFGTKQILLISNDNCVNIERQKLPTAQLDNFVTNSTNINHVGKIIFKNNEFFTIQKGRPYIFLNCQIDKFVKQTNLNYKFLPEKYNKQQAIFQRNISLKYSNRLKISIKGEIKKDWEENVNYDVNNVKVIGQFKFSKMFLKKDGKLYSCLIPRFLKQFNIGLLNNNNLLESSFFNYSNKENTKLFRTLLIQDSNVISNNLSLPKLALVKFLEYPFTKTTKSVGLYSITEDFFEKDLNSVFCYNNQFLEDGYTIGLLNLEKEITGDIVQGLPRIEEILEARKKKQIVKRIPRSQKKGILTQKTSLNQDFGFCKLGFLIKENERINAHKLLKIYFNYYGFLKPCFCEQQKTVKYVRLITNFEATYKSFKKVQSFILNSVQNIYKSQGVTINNKHLEVIIKQMTTKVLITDEGNTPLGKREIIDLYHIKSINKIMKKEQKRRAYYCPLLFGITRSALNNPSFISAASFQETTRVLTKAAIEGRIDWLRGLKENIIIGQLIPAGTGSRNYKNSFKKSISNFRHKIETN